MAILKTAFGATVRRLRIQRGMSQETLAELAGVSRNFEGSVERGESSLSLDAAERLAHALGVRLSEIISAAERDAGSA
ncbi:MAG TPA: helix-turn-helix transcriptional regulator [Gemmatimonadaceae bacterium]|nr:helix-turn-helix transcriptional regulator [Gemmatimonadaceae bacterium]